MYQKCQGYGKIRPGNINLGNCKQRHKYSSRIDFVLSAASVDCLMEGRVGLCKVWV